MFKKILAAIDASQNAKKALEVAIDLAKTYNGQLHVVSVVNLPEYGSVIGEIEEAKEEGKSFFSRVHEQAKYLAAVQRLEITTKILFGHPAEKIVDYARQEKMELIVIGQHGTSGVKGFLMGSVSNKVMHHAPCNVMLVK